MTARSRFTFAILALIGIACMSFGQVSRKNSRCKINDGEMNTPKFRIGASYEAPSTVDGGPPMTVVHVSVDPKNINGDDLIRVASKLKRKFCNDERLFLVFFDDAAYIKHVYVSNDPGFKEAEESKRGYFYVDRKTAEEYITYSTVRNYLRNPEKRVRIELGPPSTRKPETHQEGQRNDDAVNFVD